MSDIVIALYCDTARADRVRTELVREGFATDRVDVASSAEPGPAQFASMHAGDRRFHAYFRRLLAGSPLAGEAVQLAGRVERGEAAVILHPRGAVELHDADEILERNDSMLILRDVRESASRKRMIGEHAAGKP